MEIAHLAVELLTVLAAGLAAGIVCRWLGASLLIGYLMAGTMIGPGVMNLLQAQRHEMEILAETGALLLLFSVGIEFSLGELLKLSRYVLIGGGVQMVLVAAPLIAVTRWLGWTWPAALLAGSAGALSSTVLVFRALHEVGQAATPHGRRALGVLLCQDIALVPLLIFLPLLTGEGHAPSVGKLAILAATSAGFVAGVWLLNRGVRRWVVPVLARLRSVEIVVLFTVSTLVAIGWGAVWCQLPAAVGALAAGLVLSGNRLSKQLDSILLPFREVFSAVFFVTLGTLLRPAALLEEPLLLLGGLLGVLVTKTLAASVALRSTGLAWRRSCGMGLGLSQLGEFSFLLAAQGLAYGLIERADYNRILFIAICTMVLTPVLLRRGLRLASREDVSEAEPVEPGSIAGLHALVVGLGPIGRQVTSQLEMLGVDVALIDLSPINLQPLAQLGFRTFTGDARDPRVLRRAGIEQCRLAVVCVPDDDVALQMVRTMRTLSRSLKIVVRCRFHARIHELEEAGANGVVSEEMQAAGPLVKLCDRMLNESV